MFRFLHIAVLVTTALSPVRGQSSVLSSGDWYKLSVEQNGVYRINYDLFRRMGFDPSRTDPRKIRIFALEGGMLPQENAVARPEGLVELAIRVEGESDGVFNRGDYILFYAQGPDRAVFIPAKEVFFYENNLYSDRNFVFITVGASNGKRISEVPAGTGGTAITTFNDFIYHETDTHNELGSGREWFGERFDVSLQHTFTRNVEGIAPNSSIAFVSEVMAQSNAPATFTIALNNQKIGDQFPATISNIQYDIKGRLRRDTFYLPAASAGAELRSAQEIRYTFQKGSSGRSTGYLNFFSIHFRRRLALYGNQTMFVSALAANTIARYQVENMPEKGEIWNITSPLEPSRQLFALQGTRAGFTRSSGAKPEEFIAFNSSVPSPELIGRVPNQNLSAAAVPQMLIITHPDFIAEANLLASHRSKKGITTLVATTEEIYNEFSSGRQDLTAIRDFTRRLWMKGPSTLKYLLLFGKGSYDYKDRIRGNTNYVPTYESRNSLAPLASYSSDDYFGFLETEEGEWRESPPFQPHTMDIGVGRLPVKTRAEAMAIVNKIIAYESTDTKLQPWRKDIVFVADDGSNSDGFRSIHQSQADALAENIDTNRPEYNTRKIFLGTYRKTVTPAGEFIPEANDDILTAFGHSAIINYTGHGSEKLWADERVLTEEMVLSVDNKTYPFLVTATCEFGRNDNPLVISSAESALLRDRAGCIGLVTTARLVESNTNFTLNSAFYNALFSEGTLLPLGEVFKRTKNNSISGVSNRNFILLGDPSMYLALPSKGIEVDHIKTSNGSDTLKALSRVVVRGRIVNADSNTDSEFNGTLYATMFDKRTPFETIGKNNPAFRYEEWYNPLFRGKASVREGHFEFEFILPRNIAYTVDYGKLSLYAVHDNRSIDLTGASKAFKIGLSERNVPADDRPPDVQLFLGDTTFVEGGTVSPNTLLVAKIQDDNGINISGYGIGNTMMAVLNNDARVWLLNQHFTAETDNYSSGWVSFPISNLPPGKHTITVKVWDTHNNAAEKTIRFIVSEEGAFLVESFANFPNPFRQETSVFFTHNRPGDDLEITFSLLNAAGQELKSLGFTAFASNYRVDLMKPEDFRSLAKNLPAGIYFGRLQVRSLSDGVGTTRTTKLIVTN